MSLVKPQESYQTNVLCEEWSRMPGQTPGDCWSPGKMREVEAVTAQSGFLAPGTQETTSMENWVCLEQTGNVVDKCLTVM